MNLEKLRKEILNNPKHKELYDHIYLNKMAQEATGSCPTLRYLLRLWADSLSESDRDKYIIPLIPGVTSTPMNEQFGITRQNYFMKIVFKDVMIRLQSDILEPSFVNSWINDLRPGCEIKVGEAYKTEASALEFYGLIPAILRIVAFNKDSKDFNFDDLRKLLKKGVSADDVEKSAQKCRTIISIAFSSMSTNY